MPAFKGSDQDVCNGGTSLTLTPPANTSDDWIVVLVFADVTDIETPTGWIDGGGSSGELWSRQFRRRGGGVGAVTLQRPGAGAFDGIAVLICEGPCGAGGGWINVGAGSSDMSVTYPGPTIVNGSVWLDGANEYDGLRVSPSFLTPDFDYFRIYAQGGVASGPSTGLPDLDSSTAPGLTLREEVSMGPDGDGRYWYLTLWDEQITGGNTNSGGSFVFSRPGWPFGEVPPIDGSFVWIGGDTGDNPSSAPPLPGTPVVAIRCGVNELNLGPDFAADGDQGEWGSIADGGYDSLTIRIPGQVYRDNVAALGWGAEVAVFLPDDDEFDPGVQVWAGTLVEPAEDPMGDYVTLEAVGWGVLLAERDDPLMWVAYIVSMMRRADSEPWTYSNPDSINVAVEGTQLVFGVDKGDDVAGGDLARAGAHIQGHVVRGAAGILRSNITSLNYDLTVRSQSAPSAPGTEAIEDTLAIAAGDTPFDIPFATPQGAMVIALERTDGGTANAPRLRARVDQLKVRDLADAWNHSLGDTMTDICELAGLDPSGIQAAAFTLNAMPQWWKGGSWANLMSYLAKARGNPWGVWEKTEVGPLFIYRAFAHAPTWKVRAYGDDAECVMTPKRTQDVFTHAVVLFRLVGDGPDDPPHRISLEVDTGEVAPCAEGRYRPFVFEIPDVQLNDARAQAVLVDIADELATQDFSAEFLLGPIRDADDVYHNPALVKATHRLYVEDFVNPDESLGRYFRIYQHRYDQMVRQARVQGGRVPAALDRFMFWAAARAAKS